MSEKARLLWQGPIGGIEHAVYRILLPPGETDSGRLWIEQRVEDRLGAEGWRDVPHGVTATSVLETALVEFFLGNGPMFRAVKARTAESSGPPPPAAAEDPKEVSMSTAPPDELLPFRSGDYAGKRLSDLQEPELKKLALGYLRAAKEAQSSVAKNEKLAWLQMLQRWARFREVDVGPDGRVWPNWPETPGETF
jgi:hypothetical protein